MEDCEALPQLLNPFFNIAEASWSGTSEESRQDRPHTPQGLFLCLQFLQLDSHLLRQSTFTSAFDAEIWRFLLSNAGRRIVCVVRRNEMSASTMHHPPATIGAVLSGRGLQPAKNAPAAEDMGAWQLIRMFRHTVLVGEAHSFAANGACRLMKLIKNGRIEANSDFQRIRHDYPEKV